MKCIAHSCSHVTRIHGISHSFTPISTCWIPITNSRHELTHVTRTCGTHTRVMSHIWSGQNAGFKSDTRGTNSLMCCSWQFVFDTRVRTTCVSRAGRCANCFGRLYSSTWMCFVWCLKTCTQISTNFFSDQPQPPLPPPKKQIGKTVQLVANVMFAEAQTNQDKLFVTESKLSAITTLSLFACDEECAREVLASGVFCAYVYMCICMCTHTHTHTHTHINVRNAPKKFSLLVCFV